MDTTEWIRIRSWHIVDAIIPNGAITLCGREVEAEIVDDLPAQGKSCETCLRIQARKVGA